MRRVGIIIRLVGFSFNQPTTQSVVHRNADKGVDHPRRPQRIPGKVFVSQKERSVAIQYLFFCNERCKVAARLLNLFRLY